MTASRRWCNKIDLECGSTTANAERAEQVAFSPLMFVAGTKLMVPKASAISAPTDLKGKTVVVTKGTTNEQAMHAIDKKLSLGLNIVASPDHEQSYQMLVDGKADAFATDDILLYGLIARHKAQGQFKVTGEYLSYDPYGIMFRKGEPQLKAVVERTFQKLGSGRDLIPLYNKWFVARLPTGEKLGVVDLAATRRSLQGARRQARKQLERFRAKWKPVRVKKTRQINNLEPRFDSIETEKALVQKNCRSCGRPPRAAVAYSIARNRPPAT